MHALADSTAIPLPADDELASTARNRLNAIQQLCSQYGIELVLLIPPSLGRYNEILASAAGLQHINFDYPLQMGALGPEFFSDGTHLNQKGAAIFTDGVARCLRARLLNETAVGALKQR